MCIHDLWFVVHIWLDSFIWCTYLTWLICMRDVWVNVSTNRRYSSCVNCGCVVHVWLKAVLCMCDLTQLYSVYMWHDSFIWCIYVAWLSHTCTTWINSSTNRNYQSPVNRGCGVYVWHDLIIQCVYVTWLIRICTYVCVCVCVCIYIYTYIYTYIYVYHMWKAWNKQSTNWRYYSVVNHSCGVYMWHDSFIWCVYVTWLKHMWDTCTLYSSTMCCSVL